MSRVHICNTFFERELETDSNRPLAEWIRSHPIVLQLQFLPLLYAGPSDRILVSDLPENPDPRLCLIDHPPPNAIIEHWGPSRAIAAWAKKHNLSYNIPDWELTRTINSKVFSFTHSPKLPGASLLSSQEEIKDWIETTPDPKVLKTPFGTAGNGHILHPNVKRLYKLPIIGEPWVERIIDFSTQWENGQLIGLTVFENDSNGKYKGTYEGNVEPWALEEHLKAAHPLIEKMERMGYSGNIGIDAFIYLWKGEKRLHPIVEINGRKTMSWAALQVGQKRLFYTHSPTGLLPSCLGTTLFTRNITC
jgi:hypothetical protein